VKSLFGALLCFVLAQSQAWAISGGPIYPGTKTLVGSYAGVLQGAFDPTNPGSGNSIGVFSLAVPTTGNGSGAFTMFARGRVFTGTITGNADPNKAALNGVLSATFNYTIQELQTTTTTSSSGVVTTGTELVSVPITAHANGSINAKFSTRAAQINTTSNTTLKGSATLAIEQGRVNTTTGDPVIDSVLSLSVSGFRQSTTAPNTTAAPGASPAG
jgi:hypothetical protein